MFASDPLRIRQRPLRLRGEPFQLHTRANTYGQAHARSRALRSADILSASLKPARGCSPPRSGDNRVKLVRSVEWANNGTAMASSNKNSFRATRFVPSLRIVVGFLAFLCLALVASVAHQPVPSTRTRTENLIAAATPAVTMKQEAPSPAPTERPPSPAEAKVPNERRRGLKFFAALGLIAVVLLALGTAVALLRSFRQRL